MKKISEIDLFLDSSSSCSSLKSNSNIKKTNYAIQKSPEFSSKKQHEKIIEKTPISDSDSSTYQENIPSFDIKYEEYLKKKQEKKFQIEEKIRDLQKEFSCEKNEKFKEKIQKNEEKIEKTPNKLFQRLEEMK